MPRSSTTRRASRKSGTRKSGGHPGCRTLGRLVSFPTYVAEDNSGYQYVNVQHIPEHGVYSGLWCVDPVKIWHVREDTIKYIKKVKNMRELMDFCKCGVSTR